MAKRKRPVSAWQAAAESIARVQDERARDTRRASSLEAAMPTPKKGVYRFARKKPPKAKRLHKVQFVAEREGLKAGLDWARLTGQHPDDWAEDISDEFGTDMHGLYEDFFGYAPMSAAF